MQPISVEDLINAQKFTNEILWVLLAQHPPLEDAGLRSDSPDASLHRAQHEQCD